MPPERYESKLTDSEQKALDDIRDHGWHVIKVSESDDGCPGWVYSIGMFETMQHPEIVVFGLKPEVGHSVINEIGARARSGTPFVPEAKYDDLLEGYACVAKPVLKKWYRPLFGWAHWHYGGDDFPVLQCIWPDKSHRYPWEPGFIENWVMKQPMLFQESPVRARMVGTLASVNSASGEPGPFGNREAVPAITQRQIVYDDAPILYVCHDEDGKSWEFLDGGEIRRGDLVTACLRHMPYADPTLAEIADLPVGWGAWRDHRGAAWRRGPLPAEEDGDE